jgi:hypothetical protein
MRKIKINFFEIFSLSWITLALLSLFLITVGWFNFLTLFLAIFITIFIPLYGYRKNKFTIEKTSRSFKILALLTLIIGIFLSVFTTPTIFGGRDEGSYSNSAILMAQDGRTSHNSVLIENFYNIYGESKALNFPGFQYNEDGALESQFLNGYPSWLAIFFKLFGLVGLTFANLFPFVTLILAFYLLIVEVFPFIKGPTDPKECLSGNLLKRCFLQMTEAEKFGWLGVIFLLSFMPLSIFYKFTLSEIFFASLAWFSAYLLIRYLKTKRFLKFKFIFVPLLLMLFVRIETVAIIFALLIIMIGKDYTHLKQARYQFFFVFSGLALLTVIWIEPDFFINAFKGISDISLLNPDTISESSKKSLMGKILPDDWRHFYLFKIWFNYNILPLLLMASVFLVNFFVSVFRNKKFGNEKALIIIPFLLFSLTFIYLIDANISLDHPWMLRRWIFTIIPVIFFYSVFFLFYLRQKNRVFFRLIVVFIILGNLALFFVPNNNSLLQLNNFFNFSQNKGLLGQTYEISKLFQENELVLISQKSSGSGWSLISEPLRNVYNKQAVYFFNPLDYSKINREDFDNVFLITSDMDDFIYQDMKKEKIGETVIENNIINPSKDPLEKPRIVNTETKINIYKLLP